MFETPRNVGNKHLYNMTVIMQSGYICKQKVPEDNVVSDKSWCYILGAIQMLTHMCFCHFRYCKLSKRGHSTLHCSLGIFYYVSVSIY